MSTDVPPSDRLHVILEGCHLPDAEDKRHQTVLDIEGALAEVVGEHGLQPGLTKIHEGHLYSQIELRCPKCSGPLGLRAPRLQQNAAYALARCQSCDCEAEVIYRAIDLMMGDNHGVGSSVDNSIASVVRRGEFDPHYVPFCAGTSEI